MQFTKTDFTAIVHLANAMIMADGIPYDSEVSVLSSEAIKFNIPAAEFGEICRKGMDMEPEYAVAIVSKFSPEQKKYVTALLGTIMAIDQDIDDKEMALWRLLTRLCGLPSMSIVEALEYMADRGK